MRPTIELQLKLFNSLSVSVLHLPVIIISRNGSTISSQFSIFIDEGGEVSFDQLKLTVF